MIKTMGNKRRINASLFCNRMQLYLQLQNRASLLFLILLLCSFTKLSQSASVESTIRNTNNNHHNVQYRNRMERRATYPREQLYKPTYFRDQHNEYNSRVSFLDDDTLRLSLSIDDDGGLSAPSLHLNEPKVYLRVPGESGMIRPDNSYRDKNNEVLSASAPSPNVVNDHEIEEEQDTEDVDMNDNYHHHFPYIESYREKYTKPELSYVAPTKQTHVAPKSKKIWSEIIAQMTTPSSFNEINPSASENRLAEFQLRANLPSYFFNKYSSYSEKDLENVADLDDEHSKYFVKTRPRSVTTSGSNIYSNFYYEPPSFSTKSVSIPVQTNKDQLVFASPKPHSDKSSQHLQIDDQEEDEISHNDHNYDDHEDTTAMTTNTPTVTTQRLNDTDESNYKIKNNTSKPSSSSSETLDVSTSQSIVPKFTLNFGSAQINTDFKTGASLQTEEKTSDITTEAPTTTTDATSIPGTPGVDYPIMHDIPQAGFDCDNQRYKGFFADVDAKCQAWHYCDFTDGHSTFLCPNGTLFSQVLLTCDWWFNVDCDQARQLYVLNERLYRYIKPPKPSFPEDFTGEHVDNWLIQQWQMGLLPKVRKKSKGKLVTLPQPQPSLTQQTQSQSPKHK